MSATPTRGRTIKAAGVAIVTLVMLLTTLAFGAASSSAQDGQDTNSITFRYRGSTGAENVHVGWDDNIMAHNIDVSTEWTEYTFTIPTFARSVKILFDNDGLTESGADKNLIVDWMEFDGERVEIESSGVLSKGVYNGVDCNEGYRESEFLACNGYFQVDIDRTTDPGPEPIRVAFEAQGTTGSEILELEINDRVVARWTMTTEALWYQYFHPADEPIERARILFNNDAFDANGKDRNVRVDAVTVDGALFSPVNMETKGTWNGTDCDVGFRRSVWLHCNGWFRIPIDDSPDPGNGIVTVTARGTTGSEVLHVVLWDGRVAATWNLGTVDDQYRVELPIVDAYGGLRISFVNDAYDPNLGDRNVRVDSIVIGRDVHDPKGLLSRGTWNGTDCGQGYRNSNWLHCNGWFETPSG